MGVHVGEEPEEEEEGDDLEDVATIGVGRSAGAMGGGVKSSSETELWRDDEDNLGETNVEELEKGDKSEEDEVARILFLLVVCSAS